MDLTAPYHLTHWPTLTFTSSGEGRDYLWCDLVRLLTTHIEVPSKNQAAGFTPARLIPHGPRRDSSVLEMTMFVFDADQGTHQDVADAGSRLGRANVSHIIYSSYSCSQDRAAYRIVVPLAEPLRNLRAYPALRADFIERYQIPAAEHQCKGLSHFYYLPSRPVNGPRPVAYAYQAQPLALPDFAAKADRTPRPPRPFTPPPEADVIELGPIRTALESRYRSLARRKDSQAKDKATWLKRVLNGEALAPHGQRDVVTKRVCGMVTWAAPGHPLSAYRALLFPSVEAMRAQGSKLTWEKVERMLLDSMAAHATAQAEAEELAAIFERNAR